LDLEKDTVKKLLEQTGKYPHTHTYEIYFKDSEDGRRAVDAGLEKEGYVNVQRNRKSGDNTRPVITFTEKAKPYLLEPDKGQLSSVQKVSIAKEVLGEIVDLQVDKEKKQAKTIYTTQFTDISPFARLTKKDFTEKKRHEAVLVLDQGTWKIQ